MEERTLFLQILVPDEPSGTTKPRKPTDLKSIYELEYNHRKGNSGCRVIVSHAMSAEMTNFGHVASSSFVRVSSLLSRGVAKSGIWDPFEQITFRNVKKWDWKLVNLVAIAVKAARCIQIDVQTHQEEQSLIFATLLPIGIYAKCNLESLEVRSTVPMEVDEREMLFNAMSNYHKLKRLKVDLTCGGSEQLIRMICDRLVELPELEEVLVGPEGYDSLFSNDDHLVQFLSAMSKKLSVFEFVSRQRELPDHRVNMGRYVREVERLRCIRFQANCNLKKLRLDWVWIGMCPKVNMVQFNEKVRHLELTNCLNVNGPTEYTMYRVPLVVTAIADMFHGLEMLNMGGCCLDSIEPLERLFVGYGKKLRTLWLMDNCIGSQDFERVMKLLQKLDETEEESKRRGKIMETDKRVGSPYSLQVLNLKGNPFIGVGGYSQVYFETMQGSATLVNVIFGCSGQDNWTGCYRKMSQIGSINQFWRLKVERVELGNRANVPLGIWPRVLKCAEDMKYTEELEIGDTDNLRVSHSSNDKSIDQDRISVLHYLLKEVVLPKHVFGYVRRPCGGRCKDVRLVKKQKVN